MSQRQTMRTGWSGPQPGAPVSGVLQRQCSGCGNHSVAGGDCLGCSKKKKSVLQTKLAVGEIGDEFEQEADRIADQVMRGPIPGAVRDAPPRIQRFVGQPKAHEASAPTSVDRALAHSGRPLESALRRDMEQRIGYDFSGVRVHSDTTAEQSARELNANAYTVGHNIVFGADRFAPATLEGRRLLAHELTHVVQQGGGGTTAAAATVHAQRAEVVQRDQAEDDDIDFGEVTPSTNVSTPPPEFGPRTSELGCPAVPTGLSKLRPDPPCPIGDDDIVGRHFQYCLDSDVFRNQAQLDNLRSFSRSQRADAIFQVHGFASTDGTASDNLNLSCHRAKRAARELQNAGVPSQQIQIDAHGETSQFGAKQADNQIVVVGAEAPEGTTIPTSGAAPASLRDAVDRAVARILARDYRLGADAYVSRWTCGKIPNLAEMIRRTTILIEGQDDRAKINQDIDKRKEARMGHPNVAGRHEIVLANQTFTEASDPTLCAAARIVDMAFHHVLAEHLGIGPNDSPVHVASIFLVELAGLPPCETPAEISPSGLPINPAELWWPRQMTDPIANLPTGCADQPLPGPIDTQQLPARPERPPAFTVVDRRLEATEAPIKAELDRSTNRLTLTPPSRTIVMDAAVTASGDPAVVSRYQVGFVNTVVADEMLVNYVGGQRVRREVPVPMRARSPLAANTPPWSDPAALVTASASGPVTTSFNAAPEAEMEFLFEDPERRERLEEGDTLAQEGNVINTAQVRTTFNSWVIARRDDAPLDRFNTHFLEGHEARLAIDLDVVGEESAARVTSEIDTAKLGDPTPVQLRGSTADQISSDMRIVEVAPATPRGSVPNAMNIDSIRARVRQVADELAPLRESLHLDGSLLVRVFFDPASGRMVLETPARPAIPGRPAAPGRRSTPGRDATQARHATTVEESTLGSQPEGVSEIGREVLANAFTFRLRKDLVAAPGVPTVVPTSFNVPLPSFNQRRQRRGDPDPFAAEHGIGLLAQIREQAELDRSAEQLRTQPDVYDPTFSPDVQVELQRERYCFNFTVSGVNISEVCVDPTMRTEGCVRPFSPGNSILRSEPKFVDQQLGRETFHSPVALKVVTFPMTFILFTPRESPGGDTFNHEMHHMIDSFNEIQALKDRMARRIRARLKQIRQLAAQNPRLKDSLLSPKTIQEIVVQENQPFVDFFQREFLKRGDAVHSREAIAGLPPYRTELPASWTNFREPPFRGGTRGSLDDRSCP